MDTIKLILSTLENSKFNSDIDAAYLFGSQVTGKTTSKSDYDIAILFNPEHVPAFEQQLELRDQLESSLHRDVDLLALNVVSPIVSMQAVSKGKLILDRNSFRRAAYVMHLFSQYAELKEMRIPMEKNILKRKFYDRS